MHIAPLSADEAEVGQIAVFRRGSNLFGHRIIRKGRDDRGPYVLTRPDRSENGDDGPSYDEDLLGVVSRIERQGRALDPRRRSYSPIERIYFGLRLRFLEELPAIRAKVSCVIARVQYNALYRKFIPQFFPVSETSYVVKCPLHAGQTSDLYRIISPHELKGLNSAPGARDIVDRWILSISSRDSTESTKQLASMTFIFRQCDCSFKGWWIGDTWVSWTHRGMGLEDKIISKAEEIFARNEVKEISLSLPGNHSPLVDIFRNIGFREPGTSFECDCCERNAGDNARIILKKSIQEVPLNE